MRSRTSAMSASRSTGFGSPIWPKSNEGKTAARRRVPLHADRRGRARSGAARADRVLTLRRGAPEAALVHAVLVGANLVVEVVTGAVDRHCHHALRREAR